tara:strand:+ start:2113 stop:4059 length:1947 start_codon:yes stop_codon:yes gene_type:complete
MKKKSRKLPHRVHRAQTLRNAEHFREHKKGIPEWFKNSDDSYTRYEDSNEEDLTGAQILLSINKKEICCLDFGGSPANAIIEYLPHYGSPDAATHGKELKKKSVSGGHGSGGKYYALSQFKECKIINYYLGKLTVLRINRIGEYVDIEDKKATPWEAIKEAGLDEWYYFEKQNRDLFDKISTGKLNFFCWRGIGPKDKKPISSRRKVELLLSSISNHPQSRSALKARKVDAIFEGKLLWPGIKPEEPEIDEEFGIKEFALQNKIGGHKFNTYFNSTLKISLSKKPLTGEKSSLNILEIDAHGKNIAYYDLPSFMLDKSLSKSLMAHIDCPELKEYNRVSEDRVHLIEGGVTDLFLNWCRSKVKEVLDELKDKERKVEEKTQLNELRNFLDTITEEISELLEEDNILKPKFSTKGESEAEVEAPTTKEGFGSDGKIKKKGGGKRKGKEKRRDKSESTKGKSRLKILLSNHDSDPLNPGQIYNMIERQPVLEQRVQDVDYGIWWLNTQKRYIRKLNIEKNPELARIFILFVTKEIVLSHRTRRKFKEQERYDPDGLEELNFDLIDNIFSKVVDRLGIEIAPDTSMAKKIRNSIKEKKMFTIQDIAEETGCDVATLHSFISNSSNHVHDHYKIRKKKLNGKGKIINIYVRK